MFRFTPAGSADLPILIVEDLPERQIANLSKLYGRVAVVPEFDAKSIHRTLIELIQSS